MVAYTNFYETMKEALIRLNSTVICYDDDPYYVIGLAEHSDGIFRVYLEPLSSRMMMQNEGCPVFNEHTSGTKSFGVAMDKFIEANPKKGILRKMMNSPSFKKFRPFPLGMVNVNGSVFYSERTPQRHTQQGLMQDHIANWPVLLDSEEGKSKFRGSVAMFSDDFARMVRGEYPSAQSCVDNLNSKGVANKGAAFSREFAFLRGPMGILFLAYQTTIIGYLPAKDLEYVCVDAANWHLREKIAELGVFGDIVSN